MEWYTINVTPGFEQKIKNTIESSPSVRKINKKVLIPTIQRKGFISGKLYFYLEKLYPGYVFIECEPTDYDDLFAYVANISYVLNMSSIKGVYRISSKIEDFEMIEVLKQMNSSSSPVKEKEREITFKVQDRVKIISGPFSNFEGIIKEINTATSADTKIKVATRLFNNDLTFIIVSEFQIEAL